MPLQIDNWEDFKQVTEFCRNRFYRERHTERHVQMTLMAGDYFYEVELNLENAEERKEYDGIIDWCEDNACIAVVGSRPKELVFA